MSEEIHITADVDIVGGDISVYDATRQIDAYTLCGLSTTPNEDGTYAYYSHLDEFLDWVDAEPTCTACILLYMEECSRE